MIKIIQRIKHLILKNLKKKKKKNQKILPGVFYYLFGYLFKNYLQFHNYKKNLNNENNQKNMKNYKKN